MESRKEVELLGLFPMVWTGLSDAPRAWVTRYREFFCGPAHACSLSGDAVVLPWSDHESRRQVGTSLETSILSSFCSPLAKLRSLSLGFLAY